MSHPLVMLGRVNVDADIDRLAARQLGIVTRGALLAAGASADQIDRRLRAGPLLRMHQGVYRHPAVAPSRRGDLLAATLAAGPAAVASHRSAAWLHGWRPRLGAPSEILVPGDVQLRLSGVIVHRTDTLDLADVGRVGPIAVTSAARTLLDEGGVLPARLVEADLEAALLERRCEMADLWDVLSRLGGRGRSRAGVLRRLLEARAPATPALESALELALVRLLRRAGFPEPVRQHVVALALGRTARLDFAWPELRIARSASPRRARAARSDRTLAWPLATHTAEGGPPGWRRCRAKLGQEVVRAEGAAIGG